MKVFGTLHWGKSYHILVLIFMYVQEEKHYLSFLFPEEDDFVRISGMMRKGRALTNLKRFPLSEKREMKVPSVPTC